MENGKQMKNPNPTFYVYFVRCNNLNLNNKCVQFKEKHFCFNTSGCIAAKILQYPSSGLIGNNELFRLTEHDHLYWELFIVKPSNESSVSVRPCVSCYIQGHSPFGLVLLSTFHWLDNFIERKQWDEISKIFNCYQYLPQRS